jgi:tetratricopeptide (TPR) repeat protein
MEQTSNKRYVFLIFVVLIISTLMAYLPLRHNGFVNYDDSRYITEILQVTGGITLESIKWALTTANMGNWHPLTWISHMLDCQLFGLDPSQHHMVSLLFHIANTLLLFWVLKKMTSAIWLSAFVAAAFALHPLHVESVAWASERKDVLSTFFWMLTMLAYARYAKHPSIFKYLLLSLAFVLGLMAKAMLVTLPFVLLLLDYWPLERVQFGNLEINKTRFQQSSLLRLILEKIPLFFLVAILCVITYIAQQRAGAISMLERNVLAFDIRLANAIYSYMMYMIKMIYPVHLAVFYPHPMKDALLIHRIVVSLIVFIGMSIIVFWIGRRHKYLIVGWFWYVGTLVPVIGIVQIGNQAMADRYTYIPLIGLFVIVAWLAHDLVQLPYKKLILSVLGVSALFIWGVFTFFQTSYWKDSYALYNHAAKVTQKNYIAYSGMAYEFFNQGLFDDAVKYYQKAVKFAEEANATAPEIYWNMALASLKQGDINAATAQYKKAAEMEPRRFFAHKRIARFYFDQRMLNEAMFHLEKMRKLKPDDEKVKNNLKRVWHLRKSYFDYLYRASMMMGRGNIKEAIRLYRKAVDIYPHDDQAQQGLNAALEKQNNLINDNQ